MIGVRAWLARGYSIPGGVSQRGGGQAPMFQCRTLSDPVSRLEVGQRSAQGQPKVGPKSAQSRPKVDLKSTQSRPKVGPKSAQSQNQKFGISTTGPSAEIPDLADRSALMRECHSCRFQIKRSRESPETAEKLEKSQFWAIFEPSGPRRPPSLLSAQAGAYVSKLVMLQHLSC